MTPESLDAFLAGNGDALTEDEVRRLGRGCAAALPAPAPDAPAIRGAVEIAEGRIPGGFVALAWAKGSGLPLAHVFEISAKRALAAVGDLVRPRGAAHRVDVLPPSAIAWLTTGYVGTVGAARYEVSIRCARRVFCDAYTRTGKTPAMLAGLAEEPWNLARLLTLALPEPVTANRVPDVARQPTSDAAAALAVERERAARWKRLAKALLQRNRALAVAPEPAEDAAVVAPEEAVAPAPAPLAALVGEAAEGSDPATLSPDPPMGGSFRAAEKSACWPALVPARASEPAALLETPTPSPSTAAAAPADGADVRTCLVCGGSFVRERRVGRTGRPPVVCSDACRAERRRRTMSREGRGQRARQQAPTARVEPPSAPLRASAVPAPTATERPRVHLPIYAPPPVEPEEPLVEAIDVDELAEDDEDEAPEQFPAGFEDEIGEERSIDEPDAPIRRRSEASLFDQRERERMRSGHYITAIEEAEREEIELHPRPKPSALAVDPSVSLTYDKRRSRRKRAVRSKTTSVKRLTKRDLEIGRALFPEQPGVHYDRPVTRADCADGVRPCPFVSCVHHLYLDVSENTGAIQVNFPDLEVADLVESCALDVADRGGTTLEGVGEILNLTRERIRQIETRAFGRILANGGAEAFDPDDLAGRSGPRAALRSADDGEDDLDEQDADAVLDAPEDEDDAAA